MINLNIGAQTTAVTGIHPGSPLEFSIKSELSFFVPGYERSPEYMYGRWDGKKYLFTHRAAGYHELATGLVPRLLANLEKQGQPYQIIATPGGWAPDPALESLRDEKFAMWQHQVTGVMALYRQQPWRLGGIWQAATGAGKTRGMAKLIQMTRMPTVFYTHTKDLLYQAIDELRSTLKCPIGQIGDGVIDIQPITVATVQTVCRAFGIAVKLSGEKGRAKTDYPGVKHFIQGAKLVVADECHHVAADTIHETIGLSKHAVGVVGLSASPWRDDGMDLLIEAACGQVVHKVSASDLIDTGILVVPRIVAYHLPDPAQMGIEHWSDAHHELYRAWVVNNTYRNDFIANLAQHRLDAGRVVLILVKQIDHGQMLTGRIPGAEFLEGTDSSRKRNDIFKRVREGSVRCLVTTSLGDEGLDLKIVSTIILAGAGKSSTKALQRIGRALRRHDQSGKTDAEIYDLVDKHMVFKKQYWKRVEIWGTERRFTVKDVYLTNPDWHTRFQVA